MSVEKKMMINRLLGVRIRRLREARGQTQYELAEHAEVSPKHLGELERGRGNPSLRSLLDISAVLGVSLCELFDFAQEEMDETDLREEIVRRLQYASIDILRLIHKSLTP
jgi:transcriptional regulator with XRE-family HTH domain